MKQGHAEDCIIPVFIKNVVTQLPAKTGTEIERLKAELAQAVKERDELRVAYAQAAQLEVQLDDTKAELAAAEDLIAAIEQVCCYVVLELGEAWLREVELADEARR